MRVGSDGFFRWWGGGEQLLDRYFEAGRWWGDIEHMLSLTPDRLDLYLKQAHRIKELEAKP
jgi:hypothetical protein